MDWKIIERRHGYTLWWGKNAQDHTRYKVTADRKGVAVAPGNVLGHATRALAGFNAS